MIRKIIIDIKFIFVHHADIISTRDGYDNLIIHTPYTEM